MERRDLRGHRAAITCLDCSSSSSSRHLLASGSEDQTVRLWDTSTSRSVKCFHQCFDSEIESVRFSTQSEHLIFIATSSALFSFDVRRDTVLDSIPLSRSAGSFSDISAVAYCPKEAVVAVADDSDCVSLISIDESGQFAASSRKLRGVHSNTIGALAFSEKKKELVSGGFDFQLCKWDMDTFKPTKRAEVKSFEDLESSNQTLNPPFITCLQYLPGRPIVAAALGDGSVRLLNAADFSVICQHPSHAAMATSLHAFGNTIISGGLDCRVKAFKLSWPDPKRSVRVSLDSIWTIDHGCKVNSVRSPGVENVVFVSDTSKDITMYEMHT